MRKRNKITELKDIKKDPDIRVIFGSMHYPFFINFLRTAKENIMEPSNLARHILLVWQSWYDRSTAIKKKQIILEVIQSMHGIYQEDLIAQAEKAVEKLEGNNFGIPKDLPPGRYNTLLSNGKKATLTKMAVTPHNLKPRPKKKSFVDRQAAALKKIKNRKHPVMKKRVTK